MFAQLLQGDTLLPEVFTKKQRKPLVMVVLNLTSMQLTAVKYVTWVMALLTNHGSVIMIPPIRNKGQILTLLINPIGEVWSVNEPPTKRQKKKNLWNPGYLGNPTW